MIEMDRNKHSCLNPGPNWDEGDPGRREIDRFTVVFHVNLEQDCVSNNLSQLMNQPDY